MEAKKNKKIATEKIELAQSVDVETYENVAKSLYQQGVELSTSNKTLALFGKLYQAGTVEVDLLKLAAQTSEMIRNGLDLEMTGLFIFNKEKDTLDSLYIASSDLIKENHVIELRGPIELSKVTSDAFFSSIVSKAGHKAVAIDELNSIQSFGKIPIDILRKVNISTFIFLPLFSRDAMTGMLMLALNRNYDRLSRFEQEAISGLMNIMAIMLDKSLLYEELNVTNKQLENANARLKELDKQKTEFVSFATHQLRSPLTAMKGYTSLIIEGDLGEVSAGVKNTVQTIYTSIKTMINIVEDYLNVSRLELGTMRYDCIKMDMKDMLREVVNEQKSNIDLKGLKLSLLLDDSHTYLANVDPDKFKQVLMNTIDNSIKYTPSGSISISLAKNPATDSIRFKISDTGVGILPDVLPKLFQKFSRAPKASEANIHGTGLGLYIAKEIVTAHSGKIWAESEGEGKGSRFYIELPEVK